jgi:hypothetical protein
MLGKLQASSSGNFLLWGYDKGDPGILDRLANTIVEAFSGVHDFLNDHLGFAYGPTGLAAQNTGFWTALMNFYQTNRCRCCAVYHSIKTVQISEAASVFDRIENTLKIMLSRIGLCPF